MKKVYAYAHYREEPPPEIVPSDDIHVCDCVEIHLPDGDIVRAVVELWRGPGLRCPHCCLDDWYMAHSTASRICPRNNRMFHTCSARYIFKSIDKMMEEI